MKGPAALLIFVVVALLYASVGGLFSVYEVSEAREGEVVNVIRKTGEWILPLRHGDVVPSKPPLFHWASLLVPANSMSRELALRLPSIIAGALLVSITFVFAASWFGTAVGLIAAAVLCSSQGFASMATDGRVDMIFTLGLSWAIFIVIHDWFFKTEIRLGIAVPILVGLSVLAKGPLAYAVLLMSILPAVVISREWGIVRRYFFNPRWLIAVLIPSSWYLAASFKGGWSFLSRQLLFENVDRFVGTEGITSKPFYFYFKEIWLFSAPYSLLLLILLYFYFCRDKRQELRSLFSGNLVRALFFWILVPFLFYSFAVGKRAAYMLTLLPPLSILLALVIDRWTSELVKTPRRNLFRWLVVILGVVTVLPFVFYGALSHFGELISATLAKNVVVAVQRHTVWPIVVLGLGLSLISAISFYFGLIRGRRMSFVLGCCLLAQLGVLVFPVAWQIYKGDQRTYKYFAKLVADEPAVGASMTTFIKRRADESFDGFFFYYPKIVPLYVPEKIEEDVSLPEKPGLYLARQEWVHQQRDLWTARVRPILRGGRAIDSDEQQVVLFELAASSDSE